MFPIKLDSKRNIFYMEQRNKIHIARGLLYSIPRYMVYVFPAFSSMSSLHLFWALPLFHFSSLGVHSVMVFAHLLLSILARCSSHSPFMLSIRSITSFTFVLSLLTGIPILHRPVMLRIVLSMLLFATAGLFS